MMKCLLCKRVAGVVEKGKNSSPGASRTGSEALTGGGGTTVDVDVKLCTHFVLTKLFNLPEGESQELLETGIGDGVVVGDHFWTKICWDCVQFVAEFRDRHEELLEMERKVDSMRKEAHGKLLGWRLDDAHKESVENVIEGPAFVQEGIRNYFRGVFGILGNPTPTTARPESNCNPDQTNVTGSSTVATGQRQDADAGGTGGTLTRYYRRTIINDESEKEINNLGNTVKEEPAEETSDSYSSSSSDGSESDCGDGTILQENGDPAPTTEASKSYAKGNADTKSGDKGPKPTHEHDPTSISSTNLEMSTRNNQTAGLFRDGDVNYIPGSESAATPTENCFDERINDSERSKMKLGRVAELLQPEGGGTTNVEVDSVEMVSSLESRSREKVGGNVTERNKTGRRNPVKGTLFQCVFCERSFANAGTLNSHIRRHIGEKPVKFGRLEDHRTAAPMNNVTDQLYAGCSTKKMHPCATCKKSFPSKRLLNQHLVVHSGVKSFVCVNYTKGFSRKGDWKRHMTTHTNVKAFTCNICDKRFALSAYLTAHMSSHKKEKANVCLFCAKSFSRVSNLNAHFRTHTFEKPYFCKECGRELSTSSHLVPHSRVHSGVKPFACDNCTKGFTRKADLKRHMTMHTNVKAFTCNICDKRFAHSAQLTSHMLTHTKEKAYSCLLCAKGFSHVSNLNGHLRRHTLEKPNFCKECGKEFSTSSHLVRHSRVHSNDRPYKCEICGKGFAQSGHLTIHYRVHTTERPFSCNHCKQGFSRKSGLIKHGKRKNPCY